MLNSIAIERDPKFPRLHVRLGVRHIGYLRMTRHGRKPATWEAQSTADIDYGSRDFGADKQAAIDWLVSIADLTAAAQ